MIALASQDEETRAKDRPHLDFVNAMLSLSRGNLNAAKQGLDKLRKWLKNGGQPDLYFDAELHRAAIAILEMDQRVHNIPQTVFSLSLPGVGFSPTRA